MMAGRNKWSKIMDGMPQERREAIEQAARDNRVGRLMAEMRKSSGMTQVELGKRLGVGQSAVSMYEVADGLHFDTVQRIVSELGGTIVLHMPDGDIPLTYPGS